MKGIDVLDEIWESFRRVPDRILIDDVRHDETLKLIFDENHLGGQTFMDFVEQVYLPERWDQFQEDFFREAVAEDGKLVVFRCLEHPKPEQLLRQIASGRGGGYKGHVGIFWSWSSAAAKCHWGTGTLPQIHLTGLVRPSSIDVRTTVLANFSASQGSEELEIRLQEGRPVTIVEGCFKKQMWRGHEDLPCQRVDPPVTRKA